VAVFVTLANVGIGIADNATTFQVAADCEGVGGECGTAESKGYCQNNHALTQDKLGIHRELLPMEDIAWHADAGEPRGLRL
jgi:hypothetical protein